MRKNQFIPGTMSCWMRKYADEYEDREALVSAIREKFPDKSWEAIRRRINDLVARGAINPKPGKSVNSKCSGAVSKPTTGTRKSATKKVPKRFRMAIDVAKVELEYDDEGRIDEGIVNLGTSVIKDNDFRMELGIALDRWKLVSTLGKYAKNKIDLRGKQFKGTFWGQEEVLISLRNKIEMT